MLSQKTHYFGRQKRFHDGSARLWQKRLIFSETTKQSDYEIQRNAKASGKFALLTGSGFFPASKQANSNRGNVVAGLPQGVAELLVLGRGLGQLALGLQQALFEGTDPLGGVLELAPEADDLLLQRLDLLEQALDLLLVG